MPGGAAMVPVPVAMPETHEPGALILGGFFQIDVASLDEAMAWAAKLPAASPGAVEIRTTGQAPGQAPKM
ncbi:MAG: YciI family protein [Gemmobacter sp.]